MATMHTNKGGKLIKTTVTVIRALVVGVLLTALAQSHAGRAVGIVSMQTPGGDCLYVPMGKVQW